MKEPTTHRVISHDGMNVKNQGASSYAHAMELRDKILEAAPVVGHPSLGPDDLYAVIVMRLSYAQALTLERRLREELTPSVEIVPATASNGTAEPEQDMRGKRIRKGVVVEDRST